MYIHRASPVEQQRHICLGTKIMLSGEIVEVQPGEDSEDCQRKHVVGGETMKSSERGK